MSKEKNTPLPWNWVVHDHSMASLGNGDSPGIGDPLVLSISPCPACADRAEPKEWKWGRCCTPSEADADLIVRSVNALPALVKALEEAEYALRKDSLCDAEKIESARLTLITALTSYREAALAAYRKES